MHVEVSRTYYAYKLCDDVTWCIMWICGLMNGANLCEIVYLKRNWLLMFAHLIWWLLVSKYVWRYVDEKPCLYDMIALWMNCDNVHMKLVS